MDQGRQGRDQMDAAVVPDVRGQRRAAPASCARLQSWQLSPHACDTGADQGLVADELEGEADQDRREGGEPRTLCRLPNGGGRHPTTNVPGDSAADRGTTAAATTRASMKRLIVTRVQAQSTGGMRPDASENSQISPSTIVRAARAAGSHPHLASVLLQGRKSANIHASSGGIRGIPDYIDKHLKIGGLLGMDNVELRPIREHCEFLEENEVYRLAGIVIDGYFVRFYEKQADQEREWVDQRYSRAKQDQ